MQVSINVPDHIWAKAAKYADRVGIKVADIIVDAVVEAAKQAPGTPDPYTSTHRDIVSTQRKLSVINLTREGLPDALIAERLGFSIDTVRKYRRIAGLQPNRFGRTTTKPLAA